MVEGGGDVVSEKDMLEAIFFGHQAIQPLIDIQEELKAAMGKPKRPFEPPQKDPALVELIQEKATGPLREALIVPEKMKRYEAVRAAKSQVVDSLGEEMADRRDEIGAILGDLQKQICRDMILKEGRRIDNRRFDEIRPITCEVGVLPRPHGSALFTRGETQVLGILTLGFGR